MKTCDKCGKIVVPSGAVGNGDLCKCKVGARGVPADAVVTAEEAEQVALDVRPLTSLATGVKMLHWLADTKSTEHEALGELYEALEAGTDRFVEAWMGKDKGKVASEHTLELEGKSIGEVCDAGTAAVVELRGKLAAGEDEDLLNILAELDEALNKARYILKAKGEDMSGRGKVTAAGTSEGAKKGWEERQRGLNDAIANYNSASSHANKSYGTDHAADAHRSAANAAEEMAQAHADNESHTYAKHWKDRAKWHREHAVAIEGGAFSAIDATFDTSSVQCRDTGFAIKSKKVWATGEPVEFQWMPGGTRTITASYGRGKQNVPIELTVEATAESAKAVQASFEAIKGANPRRPPYGCIEHRAEERAFEPLRFSWKDDPEPAIYCECEPSELGARNVNGKIHTSFSPTFDTDAEYHQLQCSGCGCGIGECGCEARHVFRFKAGARGSASNPARVTRLDAQSVGSLTNWPAFKDILPVAASEPQGVVTAAGTSEGAKKGWEERIRKYDDIGTGKYDHVGMHQRLEIHADKAEEFEKAGDAYNAGSHARAAVRMAAHTGRLGLEHHKRAEGVLKRVEGFHIYPEHMKATDATSDTSSVQCLDGGFLLASILARHEAAQATVKAMAERLPADERIKMEGRVECGAPMGNQNAAGPHHHEAIAEYEAAKAEYKAAMAEYDKAESDGDIDKAKARLAKASERSANARRSWEAAVMSPEMKQRAAEQRQREQSQLAAQTKMAHDDRPIKPAAQIRQEDEENYNARYQQY